MNERSEKNNQIPRGALRDVAEEEREELATVWNQVVRLDTGRYAPDAERLRQVKAELSRRTKRPFQWDTRLIWTTAAFVALLCISLSAYLLLTPVTLTSPGGGTQFVKLPDGSGVELNANSALSYHRWFIGEAREVTLQGEAFFEVITEERPFLVKTHNATVVVLGTRFNVVTSLTEGVPVTEVFLVQGRVRIQGAVSGTVLGPREHSRIVGEEVESLPQSDSGVETLAWRMHAVSFRDETLGHIFAEIAQLYGVQVSTVGIGDDAILAQRLTYIAPRKMTAAALVADICRIAGLRFRVTQQGYDILQSDTS